MSKNVVFIGHYSGGKQDFDTRHFFFAKELSQLGYKTTIINAAFSHRIHDAKVIKEPFVKFSQDGVDFISIKTPAYHGNGIGRIKNMFVFVLNLVLNTKKILSQIGRVDTIIMASPQPFSIFGAKFMAQKAKAKLIVDIKDIWPLSVIELTGVSKMHPFVLLASFAEKFIYRVSHALISPLSNINEYFKDYGFDISAKYVPTGIDIDYYDTISIDKTNPIHKNKFVVGYIGGITASNFIEPLLDCATQLAHDDSILFLIVGSGARKQYLKDKYKTKNICFVDAVFKDKAFELMCQCDALYRSMLPLDLYKYGISPLKINEYMYSSTPIIHAFDLPQHDIVKKTNCGISIKSGDTEELKNAILALYKMPKTKRDELGQNGKNYVRENLSYRNLVKNLIEVL
ncbi:MAG: glycosyltransferase family 4 protein [Campylobacter sp.]|nr:glycosyltransferase family 4 protein [Campylobacter sp.]